MSDVIKGTCRYCGRMEIDGHHAYGHISKSVKPDEILE